MALVVNCVVILIVLTFGELIPAETPVCKMAHFPVQENFDETRFQGKWFVASWIPFPWVSSGTTLADYFHSYTKTDYGFSVVAGGRQSSNPTECIPFSYRFLRTGDNAKYLFELGTPDGMINMTHWVVDTDYDNYALNIGCRNFAPDGTCTAPTSWLWTRCQDRPEEDVEYMESKLSRFCLSTGQYSNREQNDECRTDLPDSCQAAGHRIQSTPVQSVMMVILSLLVFTYIQ